MLAHFTVWLKGTSHVIRAFEIWQLNIQTKQLNPIDLSSEGKTYFKWPDYCQKMKYWWKESHFCHPVSQRTLLGVRGIAALSWLEYCSLVSVFSYGIYMTTLFFLNMGNHRIIWYLGSQGEGQKSLDVNAGSAKDNRIYSNFRERQFFFNFIFFSIFRVTKKNYYISKT